VALFVGVTCRRCGQGGVVRRAGGMGDRGQHTRGRWSAISAIIGRGTTAVALPELVWLLVRAWYGVVALGRGR